MSDEDKVMDLSGKGKIRLFELRGGESPKEMVDNIPFEGLHIQGKKVYARYIKY
jgi:hypothetical protein